MTSSYPNFSIKVQTSYTSSKAPETCSFSAKISIYVKLRKIKSQYLGRIVTG